MKKLILLTLVLAASTPIFAGQEVKNLQEIAKSKIPCKNNYLIKKFNLKKEDYIPNCSSIQGDCGYCTGSLPQCGNRWSCGSLRSYKGEQRWRRNNPRCIVRTGGDTVNGKGYIACGNY